MNYYLLGKLVGYLYWFYSKTFRYRLNFSSNIPQADLHDFLLSGKSSPPFIFAIWHQDENLLYVNDDDLLDWVDHLLATWDDADNLD